MLINKIKSRLKDYGYSIRTIYNPSKDTLEVHILKNNLVIDQFKAKESNLEEYFVVAENNLKKNFNIS